MELFSERTLANEESNRTKFLQTQRVLFDRKRINLESHQLIYLTEAGIELQNSLNIDMLRTVVDYTKIFTDNDTFERYLQETCDITTFLICTNEQGKKLVPKIHEQKNLCSIYIYHQNNYDQLSWTLEYKKVRLYRTDIHMFSNVFIYLDSACH